MASKRWPEWKRETDAEIYDYYDLHILEPGFMGELTDTQTSYIQNVLTGKRKSRYARRVDRLRTGWGMRPKQDFISESAVRTVAMYGLPDNPEYNRRLSEGSILQELAVLLA